MNPATSQTNRVTRTIARTVRALAVVRSARTLLISIVLLLVAFMISAAAAFGSNPEPNRQAALAQGMKPTQRFVDRLQSQSVLTAQSLDHMVLFPDEWADGGSLDFDTLCIGIDDQLGSLGFIMSFYEPFSALSPGESVMIAIDADKNPNTGIKLGGVGAEYKVAIDRTPLGYDAYFLDFGRPQGNGYWAAPLTYSLNTNTRMLAFVVPEYYLPNPNSFRLVAVAGNANYIYDALPEYGYLQYDDPEVTTTTTIPPTTTTTLPTATTTTTSGQPPTTTTTTTSPSSGSFPDVPPGYPYHAAIDDLAARKIISGYTNGDFGPEDPVMRQQFAKMVTKTMDLPVTGAETCPFVDVAAQTGADPLYPSKYVAACAQYNITKGKTDAVHFDPHDSITRLQVVTMIVRAADNLLAGTLRTPSAGWSGVLSYDDPTHGANLRKAEYNGLLDGLQGLSASWNGYAYATRGECAQLLYNLLQLTDEESCPSEWDVITYSGNGDEVIDVEKPCGPALVWVKGNAQRQYFGVKSYGPGRDGPYTWYELLVSSIEPYEGIRLIDYYYYMGKDQPTTRLEITATGPWTIELRPLSTARTLNTPGQIQGNGEDVIRVTGNPSTAHIVESTDPDYVEYFAVTAFYDRIGGYDLLVSTEGNPYDGTVSFSRPNAYLLDVHSYGSWSIEINP